MESVLSLLLWGGLFFLMMRFCCGSHIFGYGSRHEKKSGSPSHDRCCGTGGGKRSGKAAGAERLTWEAPEKDVDPVCGKTVSTVEARPSLYDGKIYYFCSRECREVFEVLPEDYVGLGEPQNVPRLDHTPTEGGSHG